MFRRFVRIHISALPEGQSTTLHTRAGRLVSRSRAQVDTTNV